MGKPVNTSRPEAARRSKHQGNHFKNNQGILGNDDKGGDPSLPSSHKVHRLDRYLQAVPGDV